MVAVHEPQVLGPLLPIHNLLIDAEGGTARIISSSASVEHPRSNSLNMCSVFDALGARARIKMIYDFDSRPSRFCLSMSLKLIGSG